MVNLKFIPWGLMISLMVYSCKSDTSTDRTNTNVKASSELVSMTEYQEGDVPLLIGTYTRNMGHVDGKAKGLYLAYLRHGTVLPSQIINAGPNPSFIAKHPFKDFFYVVNEIGGTADEPFGTLTAMAMKPDRSLEILNTRSTEGLGPCHVSVNKYGTQVYVAHYGSGTIGSFPIGLEGSTGRQNEIITFSGQGPDPRQESSHAHYIAEGNDGRVYAVDLGADKINIFDAQGGRLTLLPQEIKVSSGAGPRHIAFHNNYIYILNELNSTIEVWESTKGSYRRLQAIGTLAGGTKGKGHSAAIKITPNGKFLYASNRTGQNSIASYAIEDDGKLEFITTTPSLGDAPRDLAIDPLGTCLLIANQNSDNIVTYKLDHRTGALSDPKISAGIMTPVSLLFL